MLGVGLSLVAAAMVATSQVSLAENKSTLVIDERAETASFTIASIEVVVNPIFDLEQDDGWIYRTANKLHIDTKPKIILRLLPFREGQTVNQKQLQEAERILRRQKFLREAKIVAKTDPLKGTAQLQVQTWENWTLFPTFSFKSEGGEDDLSYGIKDDNFLGLGIGADLIYFSEEDRSGYVLSLSSEAINEDYLRASIRLADNSDGERVAIKLDKPFYRLDERHAAGVALDSHRQEVRIDANEQEVNRFDSNRQFSQAFFGYSTGITDKGIFRWLGGITHDKYDFDPLTSTSVLPENRDLTYPWLAFSYQQDKFTTTKNLYLLAKTEDVQLGWHHYLQLGYNLETSYRDGGLVWQLDSGYFGVWNQQHWYRYGLSGNGVHSSDDISNSYFSIFYEHFYRTNAFRSWYLKAQYSGADNPYVDRPLSLGGETGLRGYPNEYQHGKRQWLINLEKRFYPDINIYKLADVAFVGFIDVGRNFGETPYPNQENSALASAGLGLRLFLTRSSGRNVININFSQPLNSDFVKDFDVSVIVRTRF